MSQWININDSLPEPLIDIRVKLTDESEHEGYRSMFEQKIRTDFFGEDVWLKDVTHWMPLPEPPKQ
jgi:hypothetical protein